MPHQDPAAVTDILGDPYRAETIPLAADEEGAVVATLVSRRSPGGSRKAVLHVHGFCDYFFQTVAADYWVARGYDFYALDLRKYGRSLRDHQTPNYVTDLHAYREELDEAYRRITVRDGHDHVVVSAHSTGGLITSLWLDATGHSVAGLFLNSPWLDMNGSALVRTVGTAVIDRVGALAPRREIPRSVTGLYGKSLHSDHRGEWDYDTAWKPIESWPVYTGWLRAVRRGHAELHRGLEVGAPVLVMTSAHSVHPSEWEPAVDSSDIVLDVGLIAKWAHSLGSHVTLIQVEGALHEVTLSRAPVRERVFDQLGRWLDAYVDHD